jgi:hypothetical protein
MFQIWEICLGAVELRERGALETAGGTILEISVCRDSIEVES